MTIGAWFGTDFDEQQATLPLPAVVTGGQDPGVCVVDQVVRGAGIVGRVTGDFGAVGVRLDTGDHPVRVTVSLQLDEVATRWWADRVKPPPGTPERPRLVTLRCQGMIRGAAVLARRQGRLRAGNGHAIVEFDVPPGDLDAGGLLIVELSEPGQLPDWAAGRFCPRGAIGLRIDRISVRSLAGATTSTVNPATGDLAPGAPGPVGGLASAGGSAPAAGSASAGGCAFVVIGPDDPAHLRLRVASVLPAPPIRRSPTNRWTRRKPARAAAKGLRLARRVAAWAAAESSSSRRPRPPDPCGVDLVTGAPVQVEVVGRSADGVELSLAGPPEHPVLVGLTDGQSPRRERTAHQLACTLIPHRPGR